MTERQRTGYRASLPKALDELLERRLPPSTDIPAELREQVAREALTSGVTPKGPVLVYVVRRLLHGLGAGDFPGPPDLRPGESAFVDRRIAEALGRLTAQRDAHAGRTAGEGPRHLVVNTDGYTKPEDLEPPSNVHQLRPHAAPAPTGGAA
jgi:hypothetical protein